MIEPKRLGAVVLSVRNMNTSLAWYREKFGFEKLYDDTPNSNGIVIGNDNVAIQLNPLPETISSSPIAGETSKELL